MGFSLANKLLKREIAAEKNRASTVRGLYGDSSWVDDLDIVNELNGHSGCINALSWSKSGRLLASGSDDTYVNIHTYLPHASDSQFSYTTAILTGHEQNIFSVKFMPYTNDRVIVTAAGDHEVRIFDVEYNSTSRSSTTLPFGPSNPRRRGRPHVLQNGVSYLSAGDTSAKVFRSHYDRVKRIVTESSPYFFLTCSEDGEVRQWDIRSPESAYPKRDYRNVNDPSIPPPLISYGRYQIDLNTISCSPSQPHYIALGGTHPHCFIHDRRMLGRNKFDERGSPAPSSSTTGDKDDEDMAEATQCVRRLARNRKTSVGPRNSDHITACKISDAHPNEVIASWSNDNIYSFDIVRTPDARDVKEDSQEAEGSQRSQGRVKSSPSLKRKRPGGENASQSGSDGRSGSHPRTDDGSSTDNQGPASVAIRPDHGSASASEGQDHEQQENGDSTPQAPTSASRRTQGPSQNVQTSGVSDLLNAITSTSVAEDSEEEEIERFLEQSVLGVHRSHQGGHGTGGGGEDEAQNEEDEDEEEEDEEDHNDYEEGDEDDEDNSGSEEDSEDTSSDEYGPQMLGFPARVLHMKSKRKVNQNVPCLPHMRTYKGHCNTQTVKDVNFYGLNDEYVVSGSDDGNFFIWDRQTARLVNILEGDGEVVNVVQGHPYEPMIATSGIDNTIKIFSADARARHAARMALGVSASDPEEHSSIRLGGRAAVRLRESSPEESTYGGPSSTGATGPSNRSRSPSTASLSGSDRGPNLEPAVLVDDEPEDMEFTALDGLSSMQRMAEEYQIIAANESDGAAHRVYTGHAVAALLAQHLQGGDEQCRPM
ncbi:WD40 repeat-like protein [Eremomyces bilateralis CBS 781.70]|uniref:WD40 repeat-like protein n=1 Tax=Eremomyces bilateralis CBS 781.70 TaxID=1392243 RepID=A0A6G1GAB6_9PEZI|nr:WD40 repeat-like protein [Eremomyces bilateralis CBS 781.70]KAF1814974.1 WD40 repeat-like protein [Eremomyces bilateralis CBS 781.70]